MTIKTRYPILTSILSMLVCLVLLTACEEKPNKATRNYSASAPAAVDQYSAVITELDDQQYPDNPDISIRHSKDGTFSHKQVVLTKGDTPGNFDIVFTPGNEQSDTVLLPDIDLLEWMPSVPDHVKKDEYLTYLALINQEWNRQQVRLFSENFKIAGSRSKEYATISRVDLARNCLNALLWEIIFYAEEEEKLRPVYHGWFTFPVALYADLFYQKNNLPYAQYQKPLENWVDPESKFVDLNILRKESSRQSVDFTSHNDTFYPMKGERKKKYANILSPEKPQSIQDFQNDEARFATFSPPGFYNTADPRKTELGRFAALDTAYVRETISKRNDKGNFTELELVFSDQTKERTTRLVVGGLDVSKLPKLSVDDVNKGYQMPMGIGNHTFYESYADCLKHPTATSSYYGLTLDGERKFLDSHALGIDGPLIHRDIENPNMLHLWILSFERHAFVGHYSLLM